MGVPKFFRYTSERYPCLNELVKQYQIPDFDNMYLDMNGIIHNCSHPDDSNPHFRITEEKIFEDIFHYLSILFQIIKPKKLFFMAIDGVAPRAKMNQQRGRRFRTAREAEQLEEEARSKGEVLPKEKRFDSNCITPGTVFMARLHEQLRYFVKEKMSTDPAWAKVKVILSGHETPGEGEHKIMDYIRWARSQPDYDPNTRHCLYGLDADLIMLGMCTHEPHFALLREEVKFGKTTQRATSPEETNFYLLHLSLLREYLEQEFITIKDKLPFTYDIEKIVDDWVLMGFLVGNDFIPNLPNMHINNDALPLLYKTYMAVLPTLSGYINEAGDLNLERFEIFMQELAKIDKEKFQDTYADLKYFEGKTGRRPNANERREYKPNNDDTFNVNIDDIKANRPDDELQALINATQDMLFDGLEDDDDGYEETSDEEANIEMEFILHKKDYYMNKLDYVKVTDEVLLDQATCYVRAVQWNLWYYYRGCASWCWFYPHHYAPYISDIKGFKDMEISFELGEPFKPFEQLLAVLPAASKHLLPTPFHSLMTDEDSAIVHYYPANFETDLNGKRNDWEAVVLIPFIDEVNLLSAMTPCYQRLTDEEQQRNSHGPMLVYNWTPQSLGTVTAPEYFPAITNCHAIEKQIWRSELEVPLSLLKRGMLPNAMRDLVYPGFPTMRHLKYTTCIKKNKVKVFDQPSRNENMIIQIQRDNKEDRLEEIAEKLLGKVVWVGWPHLTKAKVISVSNEKTRLHHIDRKNNDASPKYSTEPNHGNLHKQWISQRSTIIEHNMNRLGIELGDVNVIVHAVNHKGYKYIIQDNTSMVLEPEFCSVPCGYAVQAIVSCVKEHMVDDVTKYSSPTEAYPPGGEVFLLAMGQYYGCLAKVVESENIRSGRIKVQVRDVTEPKPIAVDSKNYKTANHAAAACGLSPQLLSRVTGSVLVISGQRHNFATEQLNKVNIGLNLKFNKKNQEVSGYTRRCKISNQWQYSDRCIQLVQDYSRQYPELFDNLAYSLNQDVFFESDLWPKEMGEKKPQEVQAWLKSQPHVKALRRECGSEALEPEDLRLLQHSILEQLGALRETEKKVTLNIKWNLLYKPELHEGNIQPDPQSDYKLLDRVVCVTKNMTVPFGAKGTVTAIHMSSDNNTVRLSDKLNIEPTYQVMFDEPFPGAMGENLFETPVFYRMQATTLLNISYGRKLRNIPSANNSQDARNNSLSFTPNLLRREDGHHSAFASYSPPGDTKPVESKTPAPKLPQNGSQPDDPTILLKSLLKISETDMKKHAQEQKRENRQNQSRNESYNQVPPPRAQASQQNWRTKDNQQHNASRSHNEWTNSGYKSQPPMPPFPTFNKPGPTSIPFPQFPPRGFHGNQNNSGFQNNQNNTGFQNSSFFSNQNNSFQNTGFQGNQNNGGFKNTGFQGSQGNSGFHGNHSKLQFPKSLPNVNNAAALTPTWAKGENLQSVSSPTQSNQQNANQEQSTVSSGNVVNTPFVPLQVQTSRRRVQNPGHSNQRKEQQSSSDTTNQQQQALSSDSKQQAQQNVQESQPNKNQRRRRPRIAANLPFQTD